MLWSRGKVRTRGRARLNYMSSLSQLIRVSEVEIIESIRDRRTMIVNVHSGYGT